MYEDDDVFIDALVRPATNLTNITWSSSDGKIAQVDDNGTVTGIAAGTATITASAGSKSVSCVVKVKPAVKAEKIEIVPNSIPKDGEVGVNEMLTLKARPRTGRGVLFLDELDAVLPLVQAACYQLILDRKLGEYELPEGWIVVAAGNRESDRAVTHRMPSALANRLIHLDFDPDPQDWQEWAEKAGIDPRIRHFLRFRPKLLYLPHLLGCAGRSLLPLRHPEAQASAEAVRSVQAYAQDQTQHAVPRF